MLALTAADPDLRFVLKEFPILGRIRRRRMSFRWHSAR